MKQFGWSFAEVDEDAERDGDLIAVAVGREQRLPVLMSAATYVLGSLEDAPVARMRARIAERHPAGAVLVFNDPVIWLPGHGPAGLLYGGLLWSDNGGSALVLRPDGGFDDALGQRGHDLAHPDARTAAVFGFPDALGLLRCLATVLVGSDPKDAEVEYFRCTEGWLVPLVGPK